MKIETIIARNVKIMRLMICIPQAVLAKKSKVSQSTIAQIENGKKTPSVSTLIKIAKALNVAPYQLLKQYELTAVEK